MGRTISQIQRELADREAIRDCLYQYARGVDRCDEEMLRSAYWEDAIDDHSVFKGTREEFIAYALPPMRLMDQRQHIITNILIRIHGAEASVESYFYGYQRIRGEDGVPRDYIGAGRYLDRFERRQDEWRIARRRVMTDWFREFDDSADWPKGFLGMRIEPGGLCPDDPSYQLLDL
jgi:ketosteroid isomerase-like protein